MTAGKDEGWHEVVVYRLLEALDVRVPLNFLWMAVSQMGEKSNK